MPLPRSFYARPTLDVARDLLGKVLVHRVHGATTAGVIVEAEAYVGEADPACHAAAGPTRRNRPMYGEPGHAYVYLNYGVHFLFNIVTEPAGHPCAVLIRALEPIEGLVTMRGRRAAGGARDVPDHELCRGPGNLTRAMGITIRDNMADLCGDRLFLEDRGLVASEVAWGPRIGITAGADRPWRCYLGGTPSVSGWRAGARGGRQRRAPQNRS